MATKNEAQGYSSLLPEILCQHCDHGTIQHGPGGQTAIWCSYYTGDDGGLRPVTFPVTVCTAYERKSINKLFPGDYPLLRMTEGRCEVQEWHKGSWVYRPYQQSRFGEAKAKPVPPAEPVVLTRKRWWEFWKR